MSLKILFGNELKKRLLSGKSMIEIGTWVFTFYWENIENIDSDFEEVLLTLNKMELGSGFAFTHEELDKIADDLIAGKSGIVV